MHRNTLAFVIAAAVGGFIAGFWLANSLNRSATNAGVVTNPMTTPANNNSSTTRSQNELSPDELRAKIAEADKNPTNFAYQKDLGTALYRYAAMQQEVPLFRQAIRILERADSINQKDFDVLVALGNAHFDIGFFEEDAASFQKAREVYARALAIKPGDADVATDVGISFFLQKPPAYDAAITQLNKVFAANPKHTRSLQFLVQTYAKQGNFAEAEKTLAKIKSIEPNNSAIAELTSQIEAAKTGTSR